MSLGCLELWSFGGGVISATSRTLSGPGCPQVCLKSVFQMDKYINNRRRDDHERSEWQKWDWQTHIFFDDCMKKSRTETVKLKNIIN